MKCSNRLRIATAAVAVVAALTTAAGMAGTASAATASSAPVPRLSAAPTVGKTLTVTAYKATKAGMRPAAGPASISCTVVSDPPSGVPAGGSWGGLTADITSVGGVSFVTCTSPVSLIEISTDLYWESILETSGATYSFPYTNQGSAPGIAGCVPGNWQAVGNMFVIWPPGYANSTGRGRSISIPTYFSDFNCT